ncbi:hypothetical protein AS52_01732 [Priestia megaterium Q3]|uniref:Uncharacterized protein n=1 Tax=Priestia megaterium Q3 TaxID=1452722 RepID=A0A806TRE5_PRIMG|nr:hypothetical protein [Priestia megaterium]AKP76697.1 hypothetical protein AS52_01732 [Priestia megaterium Q3]
MIDNRLRKIKNHEINDSLSELTDTEVLLNFQRAITSLYPHLIRIHAHACESWDDIVIPLFYEMVYKTFSFKYGVEIMASEAHPFLFTLRCYEGIHHIQCLPKASSFQGILNNEKFGVSKENLEGKRLIFKSFGDSINGLTMGLDSEDAHAVHFNLVEVDVVCAQSNKRIGIDGCTTFFIHKDDVEFEFVAETFNQKLQK